MKRNVLLASHDAGGAEILSAWYARHASEWRIRLCVDGPAERIFRRDHGDVETVTLHDPELLSGVDWVLAGTSLESELERTVVARARGAGVHTVVFLDHWDLYAERFGEPHDWQERLPDRLWVGDAYAFDLALSVGFPRERLEMVPNPYFEKVIAAGRSDGRVPTARSVLYMCEPFSRKLKAVHGARADEYDFEERNLEEFLRAANRAATRPERITVRLHPSETENKYEGALRRAAGNLQVTVSSQQPLLDDILSHQVVVGVESMALVIATLLERRVYSCITGKQWAISLPHREIRRVGEFSRIFEELG